MVLEDHGDVALTGRQADHILAIDENGARIRPPLFPVEQKLRIVLSILAGEVTVAEAARRNSVSEQSVGAWKRQFLDSGRAGLSRAAAETGPSTREAQLERENEELKAALGEATVELRVWKKPAEVPGPAQQRSARDDQPQSRQASGRQQSRQQRHPRPVGPRSTCA